MIFQTTKQASRLNKFGRQVDLPWDERKHAQSMRKKSSEIGVEEEGQLITKVDKEDGRGDEGAAADEEVTTGSHTQAPPLAPMSSAMWVASTLGPQRTPLCG